MRQSSSDRIGSILTHVADVVHRQSDQALQEQLGVGISQLRIMTILQHVPGASQRRLADHLGQTEASISRQIKLLADKGFVRVDPDPNERRKRNVSLSTKGVKLTDAANEVLSLQWQTLSELLSKKQQDVLLESLDIMHEHTCQTGKLGACDKPYKLFDVYESQKEA